MIKVLLISISINKRYSNSGIDMIAGYLRANGYCVDICYFHDGEDFQTMVNKLQQKPYDLYGFSVYSSNYHQISELSREIKGMRPCSTIVWGGSFPTMYYKFALENNDAIDFIILGDGEYPMRLLIDSLENGEQIDVPYIVSRGNVECKSGYCNQIIDYLPAWDYYTKYLTNLNSKKIHCIQTKNNVCTGNCAFCFERKGKIQYKSIDLIIREIRHVVENYGIRKIYFSDDNLLDPNNEVAKEHVRNLCTELNKLPYRINYTCYIKAISFKDTESDRKLLQFMADTGFSSMFIGIEAGNDSDLEIYNKHTTVADNICIINLLSSVHIHPMVGFINFNPFSTRQSLIENYHFLINNKIDNLYAITASFLDLYPNTQLYYKAKSAGLLKSTYTLFSTRDYCFQNQEVQQIVLFLNEFINPRITKIVFDTNLLFRTVEEAARINKEAYKYLPKLEKMKEADLERIASFFYTLYIDFDFNKCKKMATDFLNHFENEEVLLKELYHIIVNEYHLL